MLKQFMTFLSLYCHRKRFNKVLVNHLSAPAPSHLYLLLSLSLDFLEELLWLLSLWPWPLSWPSFPCLTHDLLCLWSLERDRERDRERWRPIFLSRRLSSLSWKHQRRRDTDLTVVRPLITKTDLSTFGKLCCVQACSLVPSSYKLC